MSTTQLPQTPVPSTRSGNGFGVAALVLGILALIGAFIPIVNYAAVGLAAVGLILGIVGIVIKFRPRGAAIAGTILSAIALVLSIIMAVIYSAAFFAISDAVNATHTVVYSVEGTSTDAMITYTTFANGKTSEAQATGQALPFSKTINTKGAFNSFVLSGTNGTTGTSITCKISVDGKAVSTQTSTGPNATVTCTG